MRRIRFGSLLSVAVAVFSLMLVTGETVAAQSAGTISMGIVVVNCESHPPAQITQPQDGCSAGTGIEFTATATDGTVVGSCVSATSSADSFTGGCSIEIPYGATVTVTENMATIPAGYAPSQNALSFTAPDGPPEGLLTFPVFINILQDSGVDTSTEVPAESVSSLPETGIGHRAAGPGLLLAFGMAVLIAAAISTRGKAMN